MKQSKKLKRDEPKPTIPGSKNKQASSADQPSDNNQLQKLQIQLERVIDFEQLLLEQSSALFSARKDEINQIINHTLASVGLYLSVDRVYIFRFRENEKTMDNLYEWCAGDVDPAIDMLQNIPTSIFPEWMKRLHDRETILIPEVADLPPSWSAEKDILELQSVRSVLVLPIAAHENLYGFMGFDATKAGFDWGRESHSLLRFFANNIGSVWYRDEVTQKLVDANKLSQKLAEEAKAADQEKSRFLAQISHDLRSPMNAVTGMTHLLMNTRLNQKQKHYVRSISTGGQAMLNVINSVLDLSLIESGKLELRPDTFNIRSQLTALRSLYQQQAIDKQLTIETVFSDALPQDLAGDKTRIDQVLSNLLSNAIKYSHKGCITISAQVMNLTEKKCDLSICVADEGIGMSQHDLEHIFIPFWRSENVKDQVKTGTGLGLPISKQLSELMGGSLHVESEAGKGSRFCLMLPFKLPKRIDTATSSTEINMSQSDQYLQQSDAGHAKTAALEAAAHEYSAYPLLNDDPLVFYAFEARVLIVDDHPINLEICQYLLADLGIQSDVAENGKAAVDHLQQYPDTYDLVLMDIEMPVMNGVEATKAIRASTNAKVASLPVIALTAHALQEEKTRYLAIGMNDQVNKPVDPDLLACTLSKFLPDKVVSKQSPLPPHLVKPSDDLNQAENSPLCGKQTHTRPDSELIFSPDKSLDQLHGNQALLRSMLERFMDDYARLDYQLINARQNHDTSQLKKLLHDAKAVYGAIGSQKLARQASALEQMFLSDRKDGSLFQPALDEYVTLHQKLLDKITRYLSDT